MLQTNRYGRLMWMHNGGIAEFEKIKRKLQNSLSEELFLFVEGNTDSEWAFALFLSFVKYTDSDRLFLCILTLHI
jgi:glutamine amidotransferase